MGSIAVETRLVEQIIPADPADPNSRADALSQAGLVNNNFYCIIEKEHRVIIIGKQHYMKFFFICIKIDWI